MGVIQESKSPYASPIVMVRNKNASLRICIDYCTLNIRRIPDQYTTPQIEDTLQYLFGAKWLSVFDLRSGYHHIPMHHDDLEKNWGSLSLSDATRMNPKIDGNYSFLGNI